MSVRVAQISDSHLSPSKPFFTGNFERVAEALRSSKPDLVVNTGDLSLNGADDEADLVEARRLHDLIGLETHVLPGNHDVGDNVDVPTRQPIDTGRHARFAGVMGDGRFQVDVPGWRLLGLNSLLLGSGLDAADAQAVWLRGAVDGAAGRAVAVFLHKPVCDESYHETVVSNRFLTPAARAELFDALGPHRPALFACGHVHQYRDGEIGGSRHVWAPATSFLISDPWQPAFGAKTVGYVEHAFDADGTHRHRLVTVRGLAHHDLAELPDAYGNVRAWGPGRA